MGHGKFNQQDFAVQAKQAQESKNSGFASSSSDEFNPTGIKMRFSKKGPFNVFRDVITVLIGLDVTGSMGGIPKSLLEGKLGSLMVDLKKTYNKPNENLQICFAGLGDAKTDRSPIQVGHFESDNRFAHQLQKIYLEGGGGGNGGESYNLLWWYAANKTHLSYIKQDKRKGILITMGDDYVHPDLTEPEIQMWLDPNYHGGRITNRVLLNAVGEQYEVYHITITDGNVYTPGVKKQWTELLGKDHVIESKSDQVHNAIAEIVTRHRPPVEKTELANLTLEKWEEYTKGNLTDKQWEEVLSYTLCPLTRKFMENPVEFDDGNMGSNEGKKIYEKKDIEAYIDKYQKDPITQRKLAMSKLVFKINTSIAQLCSDYKPFFDALPEGKKARLVELVLGQIQIKSIKPDESSKSQESSKSEKKESYESREGNNNRFFKNEMPSVPKSLGEKNANILKEVICPLTGEIFEDPVTLSTGQSYEKKAINDWFDTCEKKGTKYTCPMTRKELEKRDVSTNFALKTISEQFRNQAADSAPSLK